MVKKTVTLNGLRANDGYEKDFGKTTEAMTESAKKTAANALLLDALDKMYGGKIPAHELKSLGLDDSFNKSRFKGGSAYGGKASR